MFKMGCSMAKRILTIDGKNSPSSGQPTGQDYSTSTPTTSKNQKSKDNQRQPSTPGAGHQEGAKTRASGDELNDFSKLEQDPRIPLNVRQIFKITKSWKAIARTMSKTGTAMFLNLFEQNQDLFYLFDRFQHLKGKELHESMELREHAATVMSTLDHSINSLSDYDNFVTYLHSIGKLHRKVPGFKRDHFWKIEQPFLKAVKQTLDERCNETIEEIYKIAIKLIIETIADGYGEDQPDNGPAKQRPASGGGAGNGPDNGGQQRENGENSNINPQAGGGGDGGGAGNRMGPSFGNPLGNYNSGMMGVCAVGQQRAAGPKCDTDTRPELCPDGGNGSCVRKLAARERLRGADAAPKTNGKLARAGHGNSGTGESVCPVECSPNESRLVVGRDTNCEATNAQTTQGLDGGTILVLTDLLALMVAKRQQQRPLKVESQSSSDRRAEVRNMGGKSGATTTASLMSGKTDGCSAMKVQVVDVGFEADESGTTTAGGCLKRQACLINYDQFDKTENAEHAGERDAELNLGAEKFCAAGGNNINNHLEQSMERISKKSRPPGSQLHWQPNDKANTLGGGQSSYIISNINNNNNDSSSAIATNLRDSIYGVAVTNSGATRLGLLDDGASLTGSNNKPLARSGQFAGHQFAPMAELEVGTHRTGLNLSNNGQQQTAQTTPTTSRVTTPKPEGTIVDNWLSPTKVNDQPPTLISPNTNTHTNTATTNTAARYSTDYLIPNDRGETQFSSTQTSDISMIGSNKSKQMRTREELARDNMAPNNCKQLRITSRKKHKGFRWAGSKVWRQVKQLSLANRKWRTFANRGSSLVGDGSTSTDDKCQSNSNNADKTERTTYKAGGKSIGKPLLTSDPGELCELIKMLMLTVASRRAYLDDMNKDHSGNQCQLPTI